MGRIGLSWVVLDWALPPSLAELPLHSSQVCVPGGFSTSGAVLIHRFLGVRRPPFSTGSPKLHSKSPEVTFQVPGFLFAWSHFWVPGSYFRTPFCVPKGSSSSSQTLQRHTSNLQRILSHFSSNPFRPIPSHPVSSHPIPFVKNIGNHIHVRIGGAIKEAGHPIPLQPQDRGRSDRNS